MLSVAFAQTAAPVGAPSAADQMLHMVSILAITIGIFYFLIIRPQSKKQRETQLMLASIKKGDRVLTSGGVFGTVVGTGPKDEQRVGVHAVDEEQRKPERQRLGRSRQTKYAPVQRRIAVDEIRGRRPNPARRSDARHVQPRQLDR